VATFLNTPAWTMSAEAAYYVIFPWLAKWKRPERVAPYIVKMAGMWALGLIPGALYIAFNPDGIPHPDRWSYGQMALGAQVHSVRTRLQLRIWRDAGRSASPDGAREPTCVSGSE
jgi:peptidoglycan/LPS O-acetylase OafA/YrhL